MNKLHRFAYPAVALLSLVAAVAAHAESPTPDTTGTEAWAQTKTRAQVQAELLQARADGSIKAWSISYNPLTVAKTETTREAVRTAVRAEHAAEFAAHMYGEDSGSFYLSQNRPAREAGQIFAAARAQ